MTYQRSRRNARQRRLFPRGGPVVYATNHRLYCFGTKRVYWSARVVRNRPSLDTAVLDGTVDWGLYHDLLDGLEEHTLLLVWKLNLSLLQYSTELNCFISYCIASFRIGPFRLFPTDRALPPPTLFFPTSSSLSPSLLLFY